MQQRRCMAMGSWPLPPPLPKIKKQSLWNSPIRVRAFLKRTSIESSTPSSPQRKWARGPDWGSPLLMGLSRITEERSALRVRWEKGQLLRLNFPSTKELRLFWKILLSNIKGSMMDLKTPVNQKGNSFLSEANQASGETIQACFQCQKCSAGCPIAYAMDILPNQVLRHIQYGHW